MRNVFAIFFLAFLWASVLSGLLRNKIDGFTVLFAIIAGVFFIAWVRYELTYPPSKKAQKDKRLPTKWN
jgi:hypothetical protein